MRFLLNCFGSHGDVLPFVHIGVELRRRGHEVFVLTDQVFAELVHEHGLEFRSVGTFQPTFPLSQVWGFLTGWYRALESLAIPFMKDSYQALAELYQPDHTVAVGSGMAFAVRIARETMGLPAATLHLSPWLLRSSYQSPVWPGPLWMGPGTPRWFKLYQLWWVDLVLDLVLLPVNRFRQSLGLPYQPRLLKDWWHSPDLVLATFPDWFAPPQPDWPVRLRQTSFIQELPGGELTPEVSRFVEPESVVAFTTGTGNAQAIDFFAGAVEACRRDRRRALLLTRYPEQLPSDLPDYIMAQNFVPLARLLPHLSALVHHGGNATTAACLRTGVAQLIRPLSFDQPDNAQRARRLGVAQVLPRGRFTADRLKGALAKLSSESVAKNCALWQARLAGEDGVGQTCDLLEALGRQRG